MSSFNQQPKRNRKYLQLLFSTLIGLSILSSCNKNDDEQIAPEISAANVKFIHSLPNVSTLDFYFDRQGIPDNALFYTQSTIYYEVQSGTHELAIVYGGSNLAAAVKNYTLEKDKSYSLFATTKSAINDTIMTLLTTDDRTAPPAGKAKVRFVHLSQNSPGLDLAVQGGANNLSTNTVFNSYTDYVTIDPASVTFQIKDTGTSNVRASSEAVTLAAGKAYTVWAEGMVNGQGNAALGVQVIQD